MKTIIAIGINSLGFLGLLFSQFGVNTTENLTSLAPDPNPYCDYVDPVLQELPVQGGYIKQTCRNVVSAPPNAVYQFDCAYYWCDWGGTQCGESMWAKRTRLKKIYKSSDPNDLTLYSKEVTDIPQPDCCYCIMRPVPPQFIPAAE